MSSFLILCAAYEPGGGHFTEREETTERQKSANKSVDGEARWTQHGDDITFNSMGSVHSSYDAPPATLNALKFRSPLSAITIFVMQRKFFSSMDFFFSRRLTSYPTSEVENYFIIFQSTFLATFSYHLHFTNMMRSQHSSAARRM